MRIVSAAIIAAAFFASPLAGAQDIGIPACDDFIAKYEACVTTKIPAESQAEFTASIAQWRAEWSKMAADPNNKMILTGVCGQMQEQTKAAFTPYGCSF